MRILVIANLPPWVLGGAENQVSRLIETWIAQGHHVEVAGHCIPDSHAEIGDSKVRTHRIAVTNAFGRGGRALSYLLSLGKLISQLGHNFDVVYSRGLGDGAISLCLLKTFRQTRLPLVACPINARGAGDARFIRSIPGWRLIVKAINRHCEAINMIAPAIETDLLDIGVSRPRLTSIPNGIALTKPVPRNAISPTRRLIWTGRLCQQKGLDLLISALARIASSGRDFRLEIIGSGPDYSALSTRCHELGLDRQINFVGSVHRDEIRMRLATADAFILPSRYEGMSNAALEAMEAGLPLLLTRCGGIDTYVDERIGWVCEPEDMESLFATLCHLLDAPDEQLLAMGRNARHLAEKEFDIASVASRNATLLREVSTESVK